MSFALRAPLGHHRARVADPKTCVQHVVQRPSHPCRPHTTSRRGSTGVASASQSFAGLQLVDAPADVDTPDNPDEPSPSPADPPKPRYSFRNPYRKHTRRKQTPEQRAATSARMKVHMQHD